MCELCVAGSCVCVVCCCVLTGVSACSSFVASCAMLVFGHRNVYLVSMLVARWSSRVANCCGLVFVEMVCRSSFVGVVCCLLFVACCRVCVV